MLNQPAPTGRGADQFMACAWPPGCRAGQDAVVPPWSHDEVVRYDRQDAGAFVRSTASTRRVVSWESVSPLRRSSRRRGGLIAATWCSAVGGGTSSNHAAIRVRARPRQHRRCRINRSRGCVASSTCIRRDVIRSSARSPVQGYNIRALGIPCTSGPERSRSTELVGVRREAWRVDRAGRHIRAAAAVPRRAPVDAWRHSKARIVTDEARSPSPTLRCAGRFEAKLH
jgi:hypothetical protein